MAAICFAVFFFFIRVSILPSQDGLNKFDSVLYIADDNATICLIAYIKEERFASAGGNKR